MLNIAAATFSGSQSSLEPELAQMFQQALQPAAESVLLQVQTAPGQALLATTARVLVLKAAALVASGKAVGRFFPWSGIEKFEGHSFLWWRSVIVVTPDTRNERRPANLAMCSFANTFESGPLYHDTYAYLRAALEQRDQIAKANLINGPLTPISIPGIVPQHGERFYLSSDAVLFAEHTYRRYEGGSQGVSFRVMRGVYYRVGGNRGTARNETVTEIDDQGTLALSDHRLLFVGRRRTIDVPLRNIASIVPYADGLQVSIANKAPIQLKTGSDMAGLLLQRLCSNPPP